MCALRIHLLICPMCPSIKLACWSRNWFTSSRNSLTSRKEKTWILLLIRFIDDSVLFALIFIHPADTKFTFPRTFISWAHMTKRKATVRGLDCWANFFAMCEILFFFSSSLTNDFFLFFKEVDMSISFGPWFHSRHLVSWFPFNSESKSYIDKTNYLIRISV
jgi:hypothetical protein